LVDLKQNFSKQVFGYFLAAKSDKEKKVAEKLGLAERDSFLIRYHLDGVFVWKKMFFSSSMPYRWDWRCDFISMNIKTVKTVRLIPFIIILPMVETMGYGNCHSDRIGNFIRRFLCPNLTQIPAITNLNPAPIRKGLR
jgi:hypothetical protein